MDFNPEQPTVQSLEEMLGKKAARVEIQNDWVCVTFVRNGNVGDILFKFRNW